MWREEALSATNPSRSTQTDGSSEAEVILAHNAPPGTRIEDGTA